MQNTHKDLKVKFSVVIPLYNEEKSLEELYKRITLSLQSLSDSFEIIFVDDGSTDNSFAVLRNLHKKDNHVKAIRFRKNFGKSAALSVGFKEARGETIITIDADLQDLPEEIPTLIKEMDKGYDLVSGGTDNHLMLVDLRSRFEDMTGHQAAIWLAAAGIVANKNLIPFDSRPPYLTSGVRLGTPAVTTRGMGPDQMKQIAEWIDAVLTSAGDETVIKKAHKQVLDLCRQHPIPSNGKYTSS